MNFCLPKPNITRNSSNRNAQVSAGAGALTAARFGSAWLGGSHSASTMVSNNSVSQGRTSAIAMSSDR
jgi:hypothetical protein